jgi:hypothetical protein
MADRSGAARDGEIAMNGTIRSAFLTATLLLLAPVQVLAQASDVVCNQCIDNSDIGFKAVSGEKIANNAVSTTRLRDEAVTTPKLAPDAVTGSRIASQAVGTSKLANGAVTAAKLGLARTSYIEDSGNNVANRVALRAALDGLSGPAAVVLGPGTFACGASPVVIPPGVSLIGAGQALTTIAGGIDGVDGLVRLVGDDITLAQLTVVNDGGGTALLAYAVTVGAGSVDSRRWRIRDVAALGMNATAFSIGLLTFSVDCGISTMNGVTAEAESSAGEVHGIFIGCVSGSVAGTDLRASADGATATGLRKNNASVLTVRNSAFSATTAVSKPVSGTLKVISSEIDGGVSGEVICVGDYDEAGAALADGVNGSGGCV